LPIALAMRMSVVPVEAKAHREERITTTPESASDQEWAPVLNCRQQA
jgi:hypothetical protein